MAKAGKRTIKAPKFLGKAARFTGKTALKTLINVAEIGVSGTANILNNLSSNEDLQSVVTLGGIIGASVAFPPVGIAALGITGAKFLGAKLNGKKDFDLLNAISETVKLGNNITKPVCDRIISPVTEFVSDKSEEISKTTKSKVDDLFDGR